LDCSIQKNSPNNYYVTFKYIDTKNAYLEFDSPKEIDEYDFRYHSATHGKTVSIVKSLSFIVQDTDTVSVTVEGPAIVVKWDINSQTQTTSDWVGLFKASEKNNSKYLDSKYVNLTTNNVTFNTKEKGEMEVRYFSYNVGKYANFKKSNVFVV